MRSPNLARTFTSFSATGTMWAFDRSTGRVQSLPMLQFLLIDGTPEASIYKLTPHVAQAYAEQARVLAQIANRN